jgi:O-antigen/teichoic acid export membrane protein
MSSVAENNKRIAKNTLFLYIRLLFNMAVSLYTSRVVLATLGADDFGLNAVVTSAITIFYFLNYSMAGATSRFLTFELGKGDVEKLKKTFSAALTIHIIIALIILVLGETIGLWYLENKMVIPEGRMTAARWVYQLSLISAMFSLTQVPYNASIISHEKMNAYAYIEIFQTCLKLGIVFLLVWGNFDKLILYAILTLCVTLVITFCYRIYCIKHFEECKYKYHWDKSIINPMLSFSGWDLLGNFGNTAKYNGINLILNLFFTATINAAYAIGHQVSSVVNRFAYSFLTAAQPQIIKYYAEGEIRKMQDLVNQTSKFSFLLLFMLCFPLMLEIDFTLNLWLKNVPEYTALLSILFMVIVLLESISNVLFRPIHATGNIKQMTIQTSVVYIMILLVAYLGFRFLHLPFYTPLLLTCIAMVIVIAIKLIITYKLIPEFSIREFIHRGVLSAFYVIIPAIIPVVFVWHSLEYGLLRFIFTITLSILLMIISTYYIGINKHQRKRISDYCLTKIRLKR